MAENVPTGEVPRTTPRAPAEEHGHRSLGHNASPYHPIGTSENRTGPKGQPFFGNDFTKPWASLSQDVKCLFCRMAEVYAGFLSHADHHVGRLR